MKKHKTQGFKLEIPALSENEALARQVICAFAARLDPTIEELSDLRVIVSEAVTNSIVHGYKDLQGSIRMKIQIFEGNRIRITVRDRGRGIVDIPMAMTPCFTTGNEDRAGMGFSIMQGFSDKIRVRSLPDKGTTVVMEKYIGGKHE